jgi:hypothetical protein
MACQKDFTQEKFIQNDSTDTLTVINPDFDTTFTILPGDFAMVYSFKVLDTKQEIEDCKWLGDTLFITNQDDSVCQKLVTIEANWSSVVGGPEKERLQKCTFYIEDADF